MLWQEIIAVAIGGAVGAVLRFLLSRAVQGVHHFNAFPMGILTVNVLGCFAMGVLYGVLVHRLNLGPLWRAGILIGVLGGFTTFSSFSIDTITLLKTGDLVAAMLNIGLTVGLCLLGTILGLMLVPRLS
jgi:fluoride exporter